MTHYLPTELLELTYREDLELLMGRWHYQPELAELAGAYERLYDAFQRTQARHWLQDIRCRTLPDPHTTQWLMSDFFPDVAQQLGRQLRVAYVVGPALRGLINAGPDFQPLSAYAGKPSFVVNFFGEEQAAIAWLCEA
ncbi:hypothetical protein E4631_20750 [Hymenobacter sp. UV11]|uniref:hypothetical protein n=1 Tax=Hymenobacter sp. UV11 TaxID=1849735 RepID=UPI001061A7F4|nr:hypothetical protein [Hymenobacter sp. UV11]TDN40032.1 hypothetical protein A8B98_15650 [Hymenobacter sp. UV11]TFZ64055.1 hypothetical protein E4631_20750 [Hymenobacter sp. UV11]